MTYFRIGDVHLVLYHSHCDSEIARIKSAIQNAVTVQEWLQASTLEEVEKYLSKQQDRIRKRLSDLPQTVNLCREAYHRGLIITVQADILVKDLLQNQHCLQQKSVEEVIATRTRGRRQTADTSSLSEDYSILETCVFAARRYALTCIIPVNIAMVINSSYDLLPKDWFDFVHFVELSTQELIKSKSRLLEDYPELKNETSKSQTNVTLQTYHGIMKAIERDIDL